MVDALGKVRKISEELEGDLRGLQLLVEDAYQRRSLGTCWINPHSTAPASGEVNLRGFACTAR